MPRLQTIVIGALLAGIGQASELSPEYLRKVEQIDPYYALLTKRLFVTPGDFGRMVWLPSFQREMAVSIYSMPPTNGSKRKHAFQVTVTRPEKSLWDTLEDRSSKKDISISRRDTEIDADFAFAIQHAWRAILAKDFVPNDADPITLDGYMAMFSVVMPDGKTMMRDTGNPQRAPATDLVGLGIDLSLYCTASPAEQKSKRKEIMRRLQKLIATYGKP